MTEVHDSASSQFPTTLDLEVESLGSAALARLVEEVRNPSDTVQVSTTNYNRTYHRHNR